MKYKTTLKEIDINDVINADWNYKLDGEEEQIAKLKKSIERDGSAGVLAVRELEDGKYEAIDGNHRLRALRELGLKVIRAESFGDLSIQEAVTVAVRRNYEWFEADDSKLSNILSDIVAPEIDVDELAEFMPYDEDELSALMADVSSDQSFDYVSGDDSDDDDDDEGNSRSYSNQEFNVDDIGDDLDNECPRCKFRFKSA